MGQVDREWPEYPAKHSGASKHLAIMIKQLYIERSALISGCWIGGWALQSIWLGAIVARLTSRHCRLSVRYIILSQSEIAFDANPPRRAGKPSIQASSSTISPKRLFESWMAKIARDIVSDRVQWHARNIPDNMSQWAAAGPTAATSGPLAAHCDMLPGMLE